MTTSKDKQRLKYILLTAAALLLIPLIAMNFTEEVKWNPGDFMVAAILLGGTGLMLEFILRTIRTKTLRTVLVIALIIALLLIWAEMAVGIFNSPITGN